MSAPQPLAIMAAASPKLMVSAAAQDGTASKAINQKIPPRIMGISQSGISGMVKGYEGSGGHSPRHCCRGDSEAPLLHIATSLQLYV